MKLYLNELAPWERKKEYLHHIQLANDVRTQTKLIQEAMHKQLQQQFSSANEIIASQELMRKELANISIGIDKIENGIYGLQSCFEICISEVIWQIEQNRKVLKDILEVLMSPLDTQARERRRRAEEAFSNGWLDDAEEEFIESEKLNKFDFSVHISLGLIYYFHKTEKSKAIEYFDKAIKYSKPKSNYYASYSLLYKSLLLFSIGKTEQALQEVEEAVILSPDFTEAVYMKSVYQYKLGNIDGSILSLCDVVTADKLYCLRIQNDDFWNDNSQKILAKLFTTLKQQTAAIFNNKFSHSFYLYKDTYERIRDLYNDKNFQMISDHIFGLEALDREKKIFSISSYYIESTHDLFSLCEKIEIIEKISESVEKVYSHLIERKEIMNQLKNKAIEDELRGIEYGKQKLTEYDKLRNTNKLLLSLSTKKKEQLSKFGEWDLNYYNELITENPKHIEQINRLCDFVANTH